MRQEEIERALDACYEAVVSPEGWREALDGICSAMDAAAIMFYPKNLSDETAPVPCSEAYDAFLPDFLAGGWYENHYRSERGWPMLRGAGRPIALVEHDLATDEERRKLPHYNELYLKHGYPGFAAIGFEIGSEQWAMCALRDHGQGFFSREDAARMAPLAAHFRRMVRLAERFETACVSTSLEAMDRLGRPGAVLSKDGRVCVMNQAAETLMRRSADAFFFRDGRIHATHAESNRGLQALILSMLAPSTAERRDAHTVCVRVERPGRRPVLVEALSLGALGMSQSLHAHVVLLFSDPDAAAAAPGQAERLVAAFGLTPSEADLAVRLGEGTELSEAADQQGVTRETARQRLKTVFSKTDTHRQGELVSLLARLGP